MPSEQIEECPESVHELDQNMSDDEDKPLIKEENSDQCESEPEVLDVLSNLEQSEEE